MLKETWPKSDKNKNVDSENAVSNLFLHFAIL